MIIRLSINTCKHNVIRHIPNKYKNRSDFKLVINEHVDNPDFWFVYSKGSGKEEWSYVPRSNVVFIAGEPESIYSYGRDFLRQFGVLYGPRSDLNTYNGRFTESYPAQPWLVGRKLNADGQLYTDPTKNYEFYNSFIKPRNLKLISVIQSSKSLCAGHIYRKRLIDRLKVHFAGEIDVFGGDVPLEDKWTALCDYKYHIALENTVVRSYWTEKISDPLLAECYTFYGGCKNIYDFFSQGALTLLDCKSVVKDLHAIEEGINDGLYEKNRASILASKKRVLNEFNLFQFIECHIKNSSHGFERDFVKIPHEQNLMDFGKVKMKIRYNYYNRLLKNVF